MDANRYHGLTPLLSAALVTLLATTAVRANEQSTLVFSDPSVAEETELTTSPAPRAKKRAATGSLEVATEKRSQPLAQPQRVQAAAPKVAPRQDASLQVAQAEDIVPVADDSDPLPTELVLARPLPKPVTEKTAQGAPAVRTAAVDSEYVQPVVHHLPAAKATVAETADAGAELLVEAHELSQHAEAPEDYDELIALCQSAKRVGVAGEQLEYANTLIAWALNRRGQSRSDQGDQSQADADFEQALEFDPDNWRALHNRGVSFAQAGKFAEALDDFNRVVELNPLYAKAFANRATLFTQSGDLEVALADYQRASRLDPKLFVAQVGLGRTCHLLGRLEEALDAFNKALELKPDSPDVVCSRGDLWSDMGSYGEALADYAAAIDLDPEFAHAYRNGAWLLATCPDARYRDGVNAVQGAERALEFGYGELHVALDTLAAAQASNGQFEEAVDTVEKALKVAPYDARAAYRARLRLYLAGQPFLTQPQTDIEHVVYEASDR